MTEHNCRKCGVKLTVGVNWYSPHSKRSNYICIDCDKKQSKEYVKSHSEQINFYHGTRNRMLKEYMLSISDEEFLDRFVRNRE